MLPQTVPSARQNRRLDEEFCDGSHEDKACRRPRRQS